MAVKKISVRVSLSFMHMHVWLSNNIKIALISLMVTILFLRPFASTCVNFYVYVSIRTYFFLFYIITSQKHPHQINLLYTLYYLNNHFYSFIIIIFIYSLSLSLSQIFKLHSLASYLGLSINLSDLIRSKDPWTDLNVQTCRVRVC